MPLLVASIGIFASVIGTFLVRTGGGCGDGRLLWALRTGIFTSGGLVLIGTGLAIWQLDMDFNLFWVVVVGLVTGQVIGTATEVFTSYEIPVHERFVQTIVNRTGDGNNRWDRAGDVQHCHSHSGDSCSHLAGELASRCVRDSTSRCGDAFDVGDHAGN